MLIANLPFFPGFYESRLSGLVDHAEESHVYNIIEDGSNEGDEPQFHEALRLDENEISSILFDVTDYKKAYLQIAEDYASAFDTVASAVSVVLTRALSLCPTTFAIRSFISFAALLVKVSDKILKGSTKLVIK